MIQSASLLIQAQDRETVSERSLRLMNTIHHAPSITAASTQLCQSDKILARAFKMTRIKGNRVFQIVYSQSNGVHQSVSWSLCVCQLVRYSVHHMNASKCYTYTIMATKYISMKCITIHYNDPKHLYYFAVNAEN